MSTEFVVGDVLALKGITKKGKDRIRSFGPDGWTIKKIEEFIDAFPGQKGPWLLIVPKFGESAQRWVHAEADRHFIFCDDPICSKNTKK